MYAFWNSLLIILYLLSERKMAYAYNRGYSRSFIKNLRALWENVKECLEIGQGAARKRKLWPPSAAGRQRNCGLRKKDRGTMIIHCFTVFF
jgi:hypothetical protein